MTFFNFSAGTWHVHPGLSEWDGRVPFGGLLNDRIELRTRDARGNPKDDDGSRRRQKQVIVLVRDILYRRCVIHRNILEEVPSAIHRQNGLS
jgi:hypothetical protein